MNIQVSASTHHSSSRESLLIPEISVILQTSSGNTRTLAVTVERPNDLQRHAVKRALEKGCSNIRLMRDTDEKITYLVDVEAALEVDAKPKVEAILGPHIFRDCAA
ncbi:MAG: hypothetical protein WDZ93_00340 [Candidatus Paceibacterota bacterium]